MVSCLTLLTPSFRTVCIYLLVEDARRTLVISCTDTGSDGGKYIEFMRSVANCLCSAADRTAPDLPCDRKLLSYRNQAFTKMSNFLSDVLSSRKNLNTCCIRAKTDLLIIQCTALASFQVDICMPCLIFFLCS